MHTVPSSPDVIPLLWRDCENLQDQAQRGHTSWSYGYRMSFVGIYIPGRELPTECHVATALFFFFFRFRKASCWSETACKEFSSDAIVKVTPSAPVLQMYKLGSCWEDKWQSFPKCLNYFTYDDSEQLSQGNLRSWLVALYLFLGNCWIPQNVSFLDWPPVFLK